MSKAMPQDKMTTQVFATSFSGMELSRLSTWGGGVERRSDYEQGSPCAMCNIPQHVLEPIILDAAKANGAEIRFGTELIEISQDSDWAYAKVRERHGDKEYTIQAKYVLGADGARSTVGSKAGFDYEGEVALGDAISVWLKADLTKYTKHRSGALTYICPPGSDIWQLLAVRERLGRMESLLPAICPRPWRCVRGNADEAYRGSDRRPVDQVRDQEDHALAG